ncbi:hypothetical protein EVAR_6706_1 [Eumeta japonica]|uniref:Uncharacterized protein n=1 Tax=Eumeta variegata TaxID=151549 RepID=A0A4C1TLY1_EUMVA|nr:hypothetical protein EVAR_6706_1 [Eumeta japonica]
MPSAMTLCVMADELCDKAGRERFCIGIRFYDECKNMIREEFLGFVELIAMDVNTIASETGNAAAARKSAYQLHCAATKSVFIIYVALISKYSDILDPIANAS